MKIRWTGLDGRTHQASTVVTADRSRRREFRRAGLAYVLRDGDIRREDGEPLTDVDCFLLAEQVQHHGR